MKSQAGLLVMCTSTDVLEKTCPASILEWKSHRLQRAVRNTLAAEAAALDAANDHAGFLGCLMSELFWSDYRATEARESRIKIYSRDRLQVSV